MSDFKDDSFSANVSMPGSQERDLAQSYPGAEKTVAEIAPAYKFTAKYAKFDLEDEEQRQQLEEIMNACVNGQYILANEKWTMLKDGTALVVVKYLIPAAKSVDQLPASEIVGRRRQRKALLKNGLNQ